MDSNQIKELVVKAQNEDQTALTELYQEFYKPIYYFIFKIVKNQDNAQDILQDTFLSVFQNIGKLQKPGVFKAWVCQIALNYCKHFLSKSKETLTTEENEDIFDEKEDTDEDFIPHSALDNSETRNMIMKLIDALPDLQRETIILHYYEELTVEEVAGVMNCPVPTVKSRLIYARKQIKAGIEGYEKKGVKLYSLGGVPLLILTLKLLAEENNVSPKVAESILHTILNNSGTMVTASSAEVMQASAYSLNETAASEAIGEASQTAQAIQPSGNVIASFIKSNWVKIAAWSLKTKVIVLAVVGTVAIAGIVTPIIASNKSNSNKPNASQTAAVYAPSSSSSETGDSTIQSSSASSSSSIPSSLSTASLSKEIKSSSKPSSSDTTSSSSIPKPESLPEESEYGNTAENINDGGSATYNDGWVYYTANNDASIYKMHSDGSDKVKIVDGISAYDLNIVGNWLYYISKDNYIYRVLTDGSQNQLLYKDDYVQSMFLSGNWIYYCNKNGCLYKMGMDGTEKTQLTNGIVFQFAISNGYIYYSTSPNSQSPNTPYEFYKMNMDGSDKVKLYSNQIVHFLISGNTIYYITPTHILYKTDDNFSTSIALVNNVHDTWVNLNIYNGRIYYLNANGYISSVDTSGVSTMPMVLNSVASANINIADGWIYYDDYSTIDTTYTYKSYRMRCDGTGNQALN